MHESPSSSYNDDASAAHDGRVSPLDPPHLEVVRKHIESRLNDLATDPLADSFSERSVIASVNQVVCRMTTVRGTIKRNPNIHYDAGTLSRVCHGIIMVSVPVETVTVGTGPTAIIHFRADDMKSAARATRIIEAAGIHCGGWVCIAWCQPHRRGALLSVPRESEEEVFYLVQLCRLAANGAISIAACAEAAVESIAVYGGPTGVHPAFTNGNSPFFRWYRKLTPRPDGWTSPLGARITVTNPSPDTEC